MAVSQVGVFSIGQINVGAQLALTAMDKLMKLIDLLMNSPFGVLAGKAQVLSQISGLLGAAASINLAVVNPVDYLRNLLANLAALQSLLASSLANIIRDLTPQVSINAAAIASLQATLSGMLGLIDLGILGKLAALALFTDLSAKLASGGAALYVGKDANLPTLIAELQAQVAGSLPSGFTGLPAAYGVFIVAENPTTIEALRFLFMTSA